MSGLPKKVVKKQQNCNFAAFIRIWYINTPAGSY